MFIQHVKQPLGQITLKSGCRPWRLREPPKGVELNMEIARHATICIFPNVQFIKIKTHYFQKTDRGLCLQILWCKNVELPLPGVCLNNINKPKSCLL